MKSGITGIETENSATKSHGLEYFPIFQEIFFQKTKDMPNGLLGWEKEVINNDFK